MLKHVEARLFVVGVLGLGSTLGGVQLENGLAYCGRKEINMNKETHPFDVAQTTTDLTLLLLSTGHLLLLLSAELEVAFIARVDGRWGGGWGGTGNGGASGGGSRAGRRVGGTVLEAVEADGVVGAADNATVGDVQLLGAESAHKLFVVRNHNDTTLEVTDGNG